MNRKFMPVTLAVIIFLMLSKAVLADSLQYPQPDVPVLTVGVHHVIPPFEAGSKVRTPETNETFLLDELADRLEQTLTPVELADTGLYQENDHSSLALVLVSVPSGYRPPAGFDEITTGYLARPMAIMRTDTDIHRWEDLKGRRVCLSEASIYKGMLASQYGAAEKVFRAPADSLLALRTGDCDAAVHDEAWLTDLIRLPEWKKFSAHLNSSMTARQVFIVSKSQSRLAETIEKMVNDWRKHNRLSKIRTLMVRDIAFEVYLDQTVPDCH